MTSTQPNRNDPCRCGSGKKYKHCCLQADNEQSARQQRAGQEVASDWEAAIAHHQAGRLQQAEEACKQILGVDPNHAGALHMLGVIAYEIGMYDVAVELISAALQLTTNDADIYNNLGNALKEQNRLDDAIACYQNAAAIKPDHALSHYNLGNAFKEKGWLDNAVASYRKAVSIKPNYIAACNNLGDVLQTQGKHEEAINAYQQALRHEPRLERVHYNLGDAYTHLAFARQDHRLHQTALECYDKAIALNPGNADAHWNASLCRLRQGDFAKGWEQFEWRWKSEAMKHAARPYTQPLWLGKEPLQGKTILLYGEQGLGDTLQFCRYARLVADLGATVILQVKPPLVPLLGDLAGVSRVIAEGEPLPPFDYQCPLLSLPLAFGTTLENIPAQDRYVGSNATRLAAWQSRLGTRNRLRVGIVWSGREAHKHDLHRSIPLHTLLRALPPGPQYVSLQKEVRAEDREVLKGAPAILHLGDELKDFADTAALCELMDVVVSVDTSVAHLAGAMGRRVWMLLAANPDWRWLLARQDSPWYPSARLYRQADMGDWSAVMQQVHMDLAALAQVDDSATAP